MNYREERLLRKLEKKDKKIAGLNRRIEALEREVGKRTLDLPATIEQAVMRGLCNVRMIPAGIGLKTNKVVEVTIKDKGE